MSSFLVPAQRKLWQVLLHPNEMTQESNDGIKKKKKIRIEK